MSAHDSMKPGNSVRPSPEAPSPADSSSGLASRRVMVPNTLGLHMRPVMRFVDLASQFESRITVRKDNHVVDGKNPMELMLLEATQGAELEVQANGPDAARAVDALAELITSGFDED